LTVNFRLFSCFLAESSARFRDAASCKSHTGNIETLGRAGVEIMKNLEDLRNARTLFSFSDDEGNFVTWRLPDGLSASINAAVNAARRAELTDRRAALPRPGYRNAMGVCQTRDDCYAR
jgi:hypothetical protein